MEYNWENPQHEKQYVLPMFVPGSAEFLYECKHVRGGASGSWNFLRENEPSSTGKGNTYGTGRRAGIGMHVIPVEKAISTENQSISIEHISHWLNKYEGKYAAKPMFLPYTAACRERDVRMIRRTGVSLSAIWQIISLRQIKADVTLQEEALEILKAGRG